MSLPYSYCYAPQRRVTAIDFVCVYNSLISKTV